MPGKKRIDVVSVINRVFEDVFRIVFIQKIQISDKLITGGDEIRSGKSDAGRFGAVLSPEMSSEPSSEPTDNYNINSRGYKTFADGTVDARGLGDDAIQNFGKTKRGKKSKGFNPNGMAVPFLYLKGRPRNDMWLVPVPLNCEGARGEKKIRSGYDCCVAEQSV